MQLLTIGVNHQTAPLALREQVAFVPDEIGEAIERLRREWADAQRGALAEAAIVSTCNRTELYCAVQAPDAAAAALTNFLAQAKQIEPAAMSKAIYVLPQEQTVRHAFRVASGLDSMVLGEPQILGQMKQAERLAREAGGLGLMLNHLFQRSFAVAKEVRSTTQIGAKSVSMAAAAVRVAESIFGPLSDSQILFVGAGEMIELCSAHFASRNPKAMAVASRTAQRAQALATRLHAQALRLADIPEHLAQYDIVVSCTASSLPIIGLGMVERALKARRHRPMFIVDLAVPRDVEPEVAELDDVYVYTVDDLGRVVQAGHESRQAAVAQAEAIIDARVRDFEVWLRARAAVPAIQDVRQRGEALRAAELLRAQRLLARGEDPATVLEHFSQALTNKFMHGPLTALREAEHLSADEREKLIALLRKLMA